MMGLPETLQESTGGVLSIRIVSGRVSVEFPATSFASP